MNKNLIFFTCMLTLLCSCTRPEELQPTRMSTTEAPSPSGADRSPCRTQSPAADFDPESIPPFFISPISLFEESVRFKQPGPWLIFQDEEGFIMISQDGEESGFVPISQVFSLEPAPTGGNLAILIKNSLETILEIRSFPENQTILQLNLTDFPGDFSSCISDDPDNDYFFNRDIAVGHTQWSSTGATLAFTGSFSGPTSDVYTYDLPSNEVTMLTDGPSQAVFLHWSPDDSHLLFAGVNNLYAGWSGSGWSGWTFHAIRMKDGEFLELGKADEGRIEEHLLGWYDGTNAIPASKRTHCGFSDLRRLNIETGEEMVLTESQFDQLAYAPWQQTLLAWVNPEPAVQDACGSDLSGGFYQISVDDGHPGPLENLPADLAVSSIYYEQAVNSFIIEWDSGTAVYDGIELQSVQAPPLYSPNGRWALTCPASSTSCVLKDLHRGTEHLIDNEGHIRNPIWSPDSNTLFYLLYNQETTLFDLYRMDLGDRSTQIILAARLDPVLDPPLWINP